MQVGVIEFHVEVQPLPEVGGRRNRRPPRSDLRWFAKVGYAVRHNPDGTTSQVSIPGEYYGADEIEALRRANEAAAKWAAEHQDP